MGNDHGCRLSCDMTYLAGLGEFFGKRMKSRLFYICILFTVLVSTGSCAPLPNIKMIAGSELHGDHFWSGHVRIVGDVVFGKDSSLTIQPGTIIAFSEPEPGTDLFREHPHFPGSELIVKGRIVAEGTPDAPINFIAGSPEETSNRWGGVNIMQSPDARFSYCFFEGADSALHIQESKVLVTESWFRSNLVGLRFHSTDIVAERNSFVKNDTAIRFHFGSPVIRDNLIKDNRKGLFITSHPENFLISENRFENNFEYQVVLGEEVNEEIPLPGNWWGTTDEKAVESMLFDQRVDRHLGRIRLHPIADSPIQDAGATWNR